MRSSSCLYPRQAAQPIREEALLTGLLEKTNEACAIVKLAGIMQVRAVRRQHGLPWICAMPTNLYEGGIRSTYSWYVRLLRTGEARGR